MRTWLILLLGICTTSAFAVEVGGRVSIKGNYNVVEVGYVGVTSSGVSACNAESVSPGASNLNAVLPKSDKVPSTLVSWNKGQPCRFRHTVLQPGKYVLFGKAGDCLLDWKVVKVTSTSSSITGIELSLDSTDAGSVKIIFPDHNCIAMLEPVIEGFEPNEGTMCYMGAVVKSNANGNSVTLQLVSEGTYRVTLGRGYPPHPTSLRECKHHGKPVTIKVKRGELTTVKLRG